MSQYTPEQLKEWAQTVEAMSRSDERPIMEAEQLRAHAAALERIAKLEKRAEAMFVQCMNSDRLSAKEIAMAYRANFPKGPR